MIKLLQAILIGLFLVACERTKPISKEALQSDCKKGEINQETIFVDAEQKCFSYTYESKDKKRYFVAGSYISSKTKKIEIALPQGEVRQLICSHRRAKIQLANNANDPVKEITINIPKINFNSKLLNTIAITSKENEYTMIATYDDWLQAVAKGAKPAENYTHMEKPYQLEYTIRETIQKANKINKPNKAISLDNKPIASCAITGLNKSTKHKKIDASKIEIVYAAEDRLYMCYEDDQKIHARLKVVNRGDHNHNDKEDVLVFYNCTIDNGEVEISSGIALIECSNGEASFEEINTELERPILL